MDSLSKCQQDDLKICAHQKNSLPFQQENNGPSLKGQLVVEYSDIWETTLTERKEIFSCNIKCFHFCINLPHSISSFINLYDCVISENMSC